MKKENLIYGIRPVIEAIQAGKEIDRIFVKKGLQGQLFTELMDLIKTTHTPYQFVPYEKLNRMTGKNHQGIVAYISLITYYDMSELVTRIFERGETPFLLILDRVTDVRNFGAIARTAECMGAHGIIVPEKESAQINEDAVKTSAGALMTLPVCRQRSMTSTIAFLKQSGLKIFHTHQETTQKLSDANFKVPSAIIMGSEEKGVAPELIKMSDEGLLIPMTGTIDSLNVSVAAGMVMYEVARQRSDS